MRVSVSEAVERLNSGDVVALPTETVYGLAASLDYPKAIQKIFTLKGRPQDNPLIVHVASVEQLIPYSSILPESFRSLADTYWPGALTLVVAANLSKVSEVVRAGLVTVAFRIPDHPHALEVLKLTGPLVMPSANLSGTPSATDAEHVENDFGNEFPVLNGGACSKGVESTILLWRDTKWMMGRKGGIPVESFEALLGYLPNPVSSESQPLCPGQLYKHYSPKTKLLIGPLPQSTPIVGFSDRNYPPSHYLYILGRSDDSQEVGKNLYKILRRLDQDKIVTAWVDMDFPQAGLWSTIRERLTKAMAG